MAACCLWHKVEHSLVIKGCRCVTAVHEAQFYCLLENRVNSGSHFDAYFILILRSGMSEHVGSLVWLVSSQADRKRSYSCSKGRKSREEKQFRIDRTLNISLIFMIDGKNLLQWNSRRTFKSICSHLSKQVLTDLIAACVVWIWKDFICFNQRLSESFPLNDELSGAETASSPSVTPKTWKAPGPDKHPGRVLKYCGDRWVFLNPARPSQSSSFLQDLFSHPSANESYHLLPQRLLACRAVVHYV